MQVQSIENSRSNVKFSSKDKLQKASAFVNMSDDQIKDLAYISSYKENSKINKKNKKIMTTTLLALPVAAAVSRGAFTRGSLGRKALKAGAAGADWGFALVVLGVYNGIKNSIVKKSEGLQNFEKHNPITSLIVDVALFMTALGLGGRGLNKLVGKLRTEHPEKALRADKKILNIAKSINKTKANNQYLPKISEGLAKFSEKMPITSGLAKFALANAVLITFATGLLKTIHNRKESNKKTEKVYRDLKEAQLDTAKALSNTLSVERDVLAQSQKRMAKALRKSVEGQKPVSKKEIYIIQKKAEVYEAAKAEIKAEIKSEKNEEAEIIEK